MFWGLDFGVWMSHRFTESIFHAPITGMGLRPPLRGMGNWRMRSSRGSVEKNRICNGVFSGGMRNIVELFLMNIAWAYTPVSHAGLHSSRRKVNKLNISFSHFAVEDPHPTTEHCRYDFLEVKF